MTPRINYTSVIELQKFDPIAVSSKLGICGNSIRVDAYSGCTYDCDYCEFHRRIIMANKSQSKNGDDKVLEHRLQRVLEYHIVHPNDMVDHLIAAGYDWHLGGIADPWQPCEAEYHVTQKIIALSVLYGIHVVISTKAADPYGADLRPELHAIQMSVTNVHDRCDIEPNVPPIQERLDFYHRLKRDGFRIAIRIQPFIPGVSGLDIVQTFDNADHYIIEGLKLPPQDASGGRAIAKKLGLDYDRDFVCRGGMMMLRPEFRLKLYAPLIDYFKTHELSYSISDNDLRYLGNNDCCCGDAIVNKPIEFNTTNLIKTYGLNFSREDFNRELCKLPGAGCTCGKIRASNRTRKGETFEQLANRLYGSQMSPMSPKFQFRDGTDGR